MDANGFSTSPFSTGITCVFVFSKFLVGFDGITLLLVFFCPFAVGASLSVTVDVLAKLGVVGGMNSCAKEAGTELSCMTIPT